MGQHQRQSSGDSKRMQQKIKSVTSLGCSLSFGTRIREFHKPNKIPLMVSNMRSAGYYIAQHYGVEWHNKGLKGSGNERIVRVLPQLTDEQKYQNTLYLIGISAGHRREENAVGLHKLKDIDPKTRDSTHWQTWMIVDHDLKPKHKYVPLDPWPEEFRLLVDQSTQIKTVLNILFVQNWCKQHNLNYIMFNALYNGLDEPITRECKSLMKFIDTKYFFNLNADFDNCHHGWCIKHGEVINPNDEHPNVKGYEMWAEHMLPFIERLYTV